MTSTSYEESITMNPTIKEALSQAALQTIDDEMLRSRFKRDSIDKEFDLQFSLSGAYTDTLTDKETLSLATRLNLKYQKSKGKRLAGIAPTRFNLSKNRFGKYVARVMFHHKWKSPRARMLWHKLRGFVLKSQGLDFLDLVDDEDDDLNRSMVQGFKCHQLLKRPYEIISTCVHSKIPTHCQDGSLGLENDFMELAKEKVEMEEDENFFDLNTETSKAKTYSIVSIDSKYHLTIWDINQLKPRVSINMEYHFSLITFISKHYMYAGLLDQRNIKFFTPKLQITSGVICEHNILTLQYFAPKNELIAVGTQEVSIWSLDALIKGDLQIIPTRRMHIVPKLQEDEWLDMVYIFLERKQIWVIANVNIFVYDFVTGAYLHTIRNITPRRITCIAHHPEYQYVLVGCTDGTIKVLNIVNATVHEFVSHTKAVVAINVFPDGPLVVSCSSDQTMRLFNLKYFKEICSINIKDKPIGMELMDDVYLHIRTRSNIQVWATNQFNINFTTMSSVITKLLYVTDKTKPSKIIARTADGMNRFVSPVSGRAITSNLPLLEADTIIDIAFVLSLERLFVLLESGEIWVFRTDQNPCTIVDIWKSEEARIEGCNSLVVCQSEFDEESKRYCPPQLKSFSILLGATKNGHVLIFGRGGAILDRYQLHFGAITQMIFDEPTKCLYTAGLDDTIRLSIIRPLHPDIIQIQIEIQTNFVPRLLCPMGNIIAATADDASIHMFQVNLARQEWKIMTGHPKMHDHTQRVNTLTCCRPLGIFLSGGKDNSLRIWNHNNKLIREINFQESLGSICLANDKGDVLVALDLPQMYQNRVKDVEKGVKELPIPFDDSLIPFTRSETFQFRDKEKAVLDKTSPLEIFCAANLPWFDKVSNIRRRGIIVGTNNNNLLNFPLYIEDGVERFLKKTAAQIRQRKIAKENQELAKQKLAEEQKAAAIMPEVSFSKTLLRDLETMIPTLSRLESTKAIPDESSSESEEAEVDAVPDEHKEKPAKEKRHKKVHRFLVAPDGAVPNTMIEKDVSKWLVEHNHPNAQIHAIRTKKKKERKQKDSNDRENRSREYREKLKEKMKQLIDEEGPVKEPEVEAPIPETKKQGVMEIELKKQIVEMQLSYTIEKFMGYDWFPEDLVFYPEGFEPSPLIETVCTNSQGRLMRVPKITGKTDDVYPVVLQCFNSVPAHKKPEVLAFLKWLQNEQAFENTIPFQRFIIARLESMKIPNAEEMNYRMQWIEWMLELNPANPNFLLVLLHYTTCLYDNLKYKAIQILNSMGVPCVTDPFMVAKMEKICQDIRDSEFMSRDKQMRLIEVFDRFVRAGIRNYLIYSTDDIDQGKKLQGYDLFGQMIEAGNPASAKKKKKAAEQSVRSSVTLLANEFPLAERDFSKEKQEQVKEIATRVQTKILEMRTEKYPSELNEKLYPILSFPSIAAMNERPSEEILSFPTIIDYVNGFNFILLAEQLRLESQTLLEQELERKRKEQEEIARIEAQKRAEEIASRAKAAAARAALEAERKERIRLLLLAKNGQTPKEPRKHNKVKFSEMQTLGIGKTHQSCCHESREVLDAAYRSFHNRHELKQIGFVNSSLTEYLRSMNKSMPIEKIRLDPFDDTPPPVKKPAKSKKELTSRYEPKRIQRAVKDDRTELDYINTALATKTDVDYIRSSSLLPQVTQPRKPNTPNEPLFQPARKYFVPSLSLRKD